MSAYNKNVSNQSGLSIDNINVKNTVELPNITIDNVNGASFNGVIVCKNGIQLNSTPINYLNNYLGYQPTINNLYSPIISFNTLGYSKSIYSINLTPGSYLLRGQLEYFNYNSTSTISYIMSSFSTDNDSYNSLLSNTYKNCSLSAGENFIQEVSAIVNILTNTTYYLVGNIYYNGGSIIVKTNNLNTTAITKNLTQTATTTFYLTSYPNVYTGMKITGSGINQPCYVASLGGVSPNFYVVTTTTQTIAANTILNFTSSSSNNLTAIRIA
jgi:hypothetical protein